MTHPVTVTQHGRMLLIVVVVVPAGRLVTALTLQQLNRAPSEPPGKTPTP
jgi:uncharacterized protein involved in response to NO